MKLINKYVPSFYGKDAAETLDSWTRLFALNDFKTLIVTHKRYLSYYLSNLRAAEIFENCSDAKDALDSLKTFVAWEEIYSVPYTVLSTVTRYCETPEELVAYSSGLTDVDSSWVVNEFYESNGGDSLHWELNENCRDSHLGEIAIVCLSLVEEGKRHNLTLSSL